MDALFSGLPTVVTPVDQLLQAALIWCELHELPVRLLQNVVVAPLFGFWVLSMLVRGLVPQRH